jgi:hypothetical protein
MQQLSAEADYVLGETGKTVIYIFPGGDALMNRDAQESAQAALAQHQPAPPQLQGDALIEQLIAQGRLSSAQVEVGRYDHQITGLSLIDALVARGWIAPDPRETA